MASTINVEWLNQNSQRAYPFRENMRRRPTIDGVRQDDYALPDGCILDLLLAVNSEDMPIIYLSSFTLAAGVVTAVISRKAEEAGESDSVLAAVTAVPEEGAGHTPVNFFGAGTHDDLRGTIVFGDINHVSENFPDGIYRFDAEETLFEARCVRPSIPCVSGLYIGVPGYPDAPRLRGDVALVAGSNIRLDYDTLDNAIIISADSNYGYNEKCDCEGDKRTEIKSINGISVRDVRIVGDNTCVRVDTDEDGRITITDTCSKPCCGCAELTFLNQKTNEITTTLGTLESFAKNLSDRLRELQTNRSLRDLNETEFKYEWRQ